MQPTWLLAGLVSSLAKLCMPCAALVKLLLWMGSMPLPPPGMPADAGIVSGDMTAPDVGEVDHPNRLTGPANGCRQGCIHMKTCRPGINSRAAMTRTQFTPEA